MGTRLAITFGGGGDSSGPSGGLIVVLLVTLAVIVPVVVGLALRYRDRRRQDDVDRVEETTVEPSESSVFGGEWGRSDGSWIGRASSRRDWLIVGAFAAGVLAPLITSQL